MDTKKTLFTSIMLILFFANNSFCQRDKNYLPKNKEIIQRYGADMVPNKEFATKITELILYNRTSIKSLEKFKPFEINSICNDKVWEVIINVVDDSKYSRPKTFRILINKNTGEILSFVDSH